MELNELEAVVMELKDKIDTILNTAKDAEDKYNHDRDLAAFTEKHGEALGKYSDKLKKLNGDDFDIMSAAFDEYHNDFSDIEEDTYVAQLVSEIDAKIAKLKEALGEDDIEIHSDDEGKTEVNAHDTAIETETETETSEEETSDEDKEETEEEETDELAEFTKDLEAEYDKYHK